MEEITPEIIAYAGGKGSALGTGGMKKKLQAASICMEHGCDMLILNGDDPKILYDAVDCELVGTKFLGAKK